MTAVRRGQRSRKRQPAVGCFHHRAIAGSVLHEHLPAHGSEVRHRLVAVLTALLRKGVRRAIFLDPTGARRSGLETVVPI